MFIPRHPVVENQFCQYVAQTGTGSAGVGGVVAYAGSVIKLKTDAANQESQISKMAHGDSGTVPFGFLMQKVKTGYHQVHPTGFVMPGDLGSSDAIAQASYDANGNITGTKAVPVGVAHLGIYDTVHYICKMTASVVQAGDGMDPGDNLLAAADEAKVTNNATNASTGVAADDKANGSYVAGCTTVVARVMKGASVAKCQANFANTTLYPIRIKLLV
jgi:hypothetical protein